MEIVSITVNFRDEEHTTEVDGITVCRTIEATFKNGEWTIDGPIYSRILLALHDVWKRLRQEVKNG